MSIFKIFGKVYAFLVMCVGVGVTFVIGSLIGLFSSFTAHGTAMRDMQDSSLEGHFLPEDKFTSKEKDSSGIPVYMDKNGRETNGYKFPKKQEL